MPGPLSYKTFNVSADTKGNMKFAVLRDDGTEVALASMTTKEASRIAGIFLDASREAYEKSGKPPRYCSEEDQTDLTAILPSGFSIIPGRKPGKVTMIFHFGDTSLGIEIPNDKGRIFAQQLLNKTTSETPP